MQRHLLFVLLPVLLFAANRPAWSQVPSEISYQGVIHVDGNPSEHPGSLSSIIVRLFDRQSDGEPIHTSAFTGTTLQYDPAYGTFNVVLGKGTLQNGKPISELPFDKQYWLTVEVQAERVTQTQSVRTPLTSVPYALRSLHPEVPVGTIVAFFGLSKSVPDGWLLCDGQDISNDDYPILYEQLADLGFQGRVPNMQGMFLRGADLGTARTGYRDAGRSARLLPGDAQVPAGNPEKIGTVQTDTIQSHRHDFSDRTVDVSQQNPADEDGWWSFQSGSGLWVNELQTVGAHTATSDGPETRPNNVYINWIIKAR